MSQSIFYKVCSQCMAQAPVNATVCACGQSFELHQGSDSSLTAEVMRTETEEQLYEAYLEARLQQMMEALRAVREACGPGKWTPEQLAKAQRALRAVEEAKKELAAQREKSARASEAVHTRKTGGPGCPQAAALPTTSATAAPMPAAATTPTQTRIPVPDMPSVQELSAMPGTTFRNTQAAKAQRICSAPKNAPRPVLDATPAEKTIPIPEFELHTEEYAIARVIDGFRRHA